MATCYGAVSSTLHLKLKYPTGEGVAELVGCQVVAKQCMVASVNHRVFEVSSSEIGPPYSNHSPFANLLELFSIM